MDVAQPPLSAPADRCKTCQSNSTRNSRSNVASRNFLANVKPEAGKYLLASCGYRGNVATQEVDNEIAKQKMSDDFVTWVPKTIKSSIITVQPQDTPMNGTFANSTALESVFQRVRAQFGKLCKRKTFFVLVPSTKVKVWMKWNIKNLHCVFVMLHNVIAWLWSRSLFCVVCVPKRWSLVVDSYNSIEKMLRLFFSA